MHPSKIERAIAPHAENRQLIGRTLNFSYGFSDFIRAAPIGARRPDPAFVDEGHDGLVVGSRQDVHELWNVVGSFPTTLGASR